MKLMKWIITGILCLTMVGIWGNEPRSLRDVGVQWARLSDRAQVEMLVNELREATVDPVRLSIVSQRLGMAAGVTADLASLAAAIPAGQTPAIYLDGAHAVVEFKDMMALEMEKTSDNWTIRKLNLDRRQDVQEGGGGQQAIPAGSGFSTGNTFMATPLSATHDIERLSRSITESHLSRELFGAPEKSVSYYQASYTNSAPYVSASFVQLVADPAWNRILYGRLDRWIKSYDDILGPADLAVDPTARLFVAERGRQQVRVLQLDADNEQSSLTPLFNIDGLGEPVALAHADGQTPFDISDDHLYVIDASRSSILKYALDSHHATEVALLDEQVAPSAIAVGKWNGLSTDLLYVVDNVGKRLTLYQDRDGMFQKLRVIRAGYDQYFSDLTLDHFGNVYVVDNINSHLYKYSAALQLLDSEGGESAYDGLAAVDIPFGRIFIEGEGEYWAGFDQAFAMERWTDHSGAQRRTLGVRLKDVSFQADDDVSQVSSQFTLTDAADVVARIINERNEVIREIKPGFMSAGNGNIQWNRRDNAGGQVAAGNYRYELSAQSAYQEDSRISLAAAFYLPTFTWQNCGSVNADDDHLRIQGRPVSWGATPMETATVHEDRVVYRFGGLNPESKYEIAVECFAGDGVQRVQHIVANDLFELSEMHLGDGPQRTRYLKIPEAAYENGEVTISVVAGNRNGALVSQIWFKEVGAAFFPQPYLEQETIPRAFVLEQNYPNPFNPSTTIRYQLPEASDVALEIYNVLGQKVRVLAQGAHDAGIYARVWDGQSDTGQQVSSGIYFYRLAAGGFVETRGMLFLK